MSVLSPAVTWPARCRVSRGADGQSAMSVSPDTDCRLRGAIAALATCASRFRIFKFALLRNGGCHKSAAAHIRSAGRCTLLFFHRDNPRKSKLKITIFITQIHAVVNCMNPHKPGRTSFWQFWLCINFLKNLGVFAKHSAWTENCTSSTLRQLTRPFYLPQLLGISGQRLGDRNHSPKILRATDLLVEKLRSLGG